jgi:hypothetical protein
MWVQVNRDALTNPTIKMFVDAGGISGRDSFIGSGIGMGGMVDQIAYWATQSFDVQVITNTADIGIYRVIIEDTGHGKQAEKVLTVSLATGQEYVWVDYQITNTGSEAWTYNEYPSHIHNGAHLGTVLPVETVNIEAYIHGVGVINLTSLDWWYSYTPDQSAPFFVLYRPSNGEAVTYGFKEQIAYPVHQVVAYYTGAGPALEPHLDAMASAFTLNPGESARWNIILAFHAGGYDKGGAIYITATPPGRYNISGAVTDGSDNPIPDVNISANNLRKTITNASGHYTVTDLITGTYIITPTRIGYGFSPTSYQVSLPPNATAKNFTAVPLQTQFLPCVINYFARPFYGSIAGAVTSTDTGAPIPGAQVCVLSTNQCDTTDSDGLYYIPGVLIGTQTVHAAADGYYPSDQTALIQWNQTALVGFALQLHP